MAAAALSKRVKGISLFESLSLNSTRFNYFGFIIKIAEQLDLEVRDNYKLFENVFVKQKGYCEWPAQITKIDKSRKSPYFVIFYGWHDSWYDSHTMTIRFFSSF